MLSVGQGDCVVYQSDKWDVLIDVGPKNRYSNAGERIVLPYLRSHGVRSIDLIVITHPDLDHIGGLESVARRHKIGALVVSGAFLKETSLFRFPNGMTSKLFLFLGQFR